MAENTTVGPTGPGKSFSAGKPDNYTPDRTGGSEVDEAASGNGEAGPAGEYDSYSNAGGGAAGSEGLASGDHSTVGVDGKIPS